MNWHVAEIDNTRPEKMNRKMNDYRCYNCGKPAQYKANSMCGVYLCRDCAEKKYGIEKTIKCYNCGLEIESRPVIIERFSKTYYYCSVDCVMDEFGFKKLA